MTDYTLLGQASFSPGTQSAYGEGGSQPSLAILPDGTFFMAQWVETASGGGDLGVVRMWHLSASLAVLGTVDVAHGSGTAPVTYAVTAIGMNVLLLIGLYGAGDYACLVNCSGAAPVPGLEVSIPVDPYLDGWGYPAQVIRDTATDRIIILVNTTVSGVRLPALTVFKMSTGAYLSTARATPATGDIGLGVAMDPTDPTKFTMTTVFPLRYDFTVSADGTTTTYVGPGSVIAAPAALHIWRYGAWNYPQVAGSPFAPYAGGIGTEDWPSSTTSFYWIENGVDVTSLSEEDRWTNVPGTRDSLMNERYALTAQEWGAGTWPNYFGCRLYSWDQLAGPAAIEVMELPYFDVPPFVTGVGPVTVTWLNQGAVMAVDQISGKVIVATNVVTQLSYPTPDSFITLVWVIQGPSDKPNLTGGPLGTDVYFDPR